MSVIEELSNQDEDDEDKKSYKKIDLERLLKVNLNDLDKIENRRNITNKLNQKKKEFKDMEKSIDSLESELMYENVDLARKILKDHDKDYDEILKNKDNVGILHVDRDIIKIKDILTENNNIGYLSLFVKLILEKDKYHSYANGFNRILEIYAKIKKYKSIIGNLRDNNGNIKNLLDFDTYESLNDSLNRLEEWTIVRDFIKEFPSAQKRLIWANNWFIDELKNKSEYLIKSILKIKADSNLLDIFLRKISSIKTTDELISTFSRITNEYPWTYDFWLNKLNNTRNVYVTWSSQEKNQIICIVLSHTAIKKIAYMTNWCIVRGSDYFYSYSNKGFQCILYDFNQKQSSNDSITGFTIDADNFITNCHNKSDNYSKVPNDFTIGKGFIRDEYVKINLKDAMSKFDNTIFKILRNKLKKVLNKPYISKFIDFYDN